MAADARTVEVEKTGDGADGGETDEKGGTGKAVDTDKNDADDGGVHSILTIGEDARSL